MLKMKYFVLKPKGDTVHAEASRRAMCAYADWVREHSERMEDVEFARQLDAWARDEAAAVSAGFGTGGLDR